MTYFLGGGHILQNGWIIWSPLLYFNFKSFKDPNSFSNIRFQCKLYDSGVLFSESSNFQKSKRGDVISWGNQFCRTTELFGPPYCISILKVLNTQIFCYSLDFNAFCFYSGVLFSEFRNFYKLKRGHLISWGETILQNGWTIRSPLLYFNFKSFKDPNSSSFIRFQCILHDSGVPFPGFSNFKKLKRGDLIS